ncbi:MAG: DNA-3-methyladenine glycosylase 2 family protein [Erysipelotrichaceae bacterium]|nr:DNA-3-methyladenine glycosylase 2 family protein [Erysipelotrichaceae bacterium]
MVMIISFIISQRNNIKRIRTCIGRLCEKYGEKKVIYNGEGTLRRELFGETTVYYDFPTPKALADADISDIRALGVGYRDVYIKKAAEAVMYGDIDIDAVKKMDYEAAKRELLGLFGVGEKVADCICLFALHLTEAFPRDTHIISIVNNEYGGEFPFDMYEGYAGVLQQYMFFYDLKI